MTCCSVFPVIPCLESYDDKWRDICGKKIYADGSSFEPKIYTVSTTSGNVFLKTESADISLISALMIPGYALYGAASIVFHTLRIFPDLYVHLKEGEICNALVAVAIDIWNIIRDLIYTPLLMLAALYGILFSHEGRELMAMLDLSWHHGVNYEGDYRNTLIKREQSQLRKLESSKDLTPEDVAKKQELTDKFKDMSDFKVFWTAAKAAKVFYLPWCMQSRGNVRKSNISVVWDRTDDTTKKLLKERLNLAPVAPQ